MTESQRWFLRRQAVHFAELCNCPARWVLDGMEPQTRKSMEARRMALQTGRDNGISDRDLAGFFRLDRSTVWRALSEGPDELPMPEVSAIGPGREIVQGRTRDYERYRGALERKAKRAG